MKNKSRLFIVALPIDSRWDLLDPRVVFAIKNCDLLIAEEKKTAFRILASSDNRGKTFRLINEHSSDADRHDVINLVKNSETAVLISDAGTPCIADPDYKLVSMCHENNIDVLSVPGASSITAALSVSGFDSSRFTYMGFIPKEKSAKEQFIKDIKLSSMTTVVMERPYKLKDTILLFKSFERMLCVCINLGSHLDEENKELILRGYPKDILKRVPDIKAAFTIVIDKI